MQALLPAAALALLAAAPVSAASLYRATLETPSAKTLVVRDLRWVCAGSACAAPRDPSSSDTTVCSAVARKLGRMTRFEAAERAFDADQLARCNAAAR